jgi:predicted anti-sigma-YlaC factor YlaD
MDATRRMLAITCADALELMTDHLEGALSEADAVRMRAHLGGCAACKVFLDQLEATIRVVHDAGKSQEFSVAPERIDELAALFKAQHGE